MQSTEMRASDLAFTVGDLHSRLCETNVGALVRRWLACSGSVTSLSQSVGYEVVCQFVRCHKVAYY